MGKKKHSEEKIIYALKQADAGTPIRTDEWSCTGVGSGSIAHQADQLSKTLPSLLDRASM